MERERKGKSILIGVLCAIILFMSIGFANWISILDINGDAAVGSTWNVQITSIEQTNATEGVVELETPNATATSASFNVTLAEPGDTVSYKVIVSNQGTLDAVLNSKVLTGDDAVDAIIYEVDGPEVGEEGAKLAAGETHTYIVTVTYDETAIGEDAPENDAAESLTVTLNYGQDTTNA